MLAKRTLNITYARINKEAAMHDQWLAKKIFGEIIGEQAIVVKLMFVDVFLLLNWYCPGFYC